MELFGRRTVALGPHPPKVSLWAPPSPAPKRGRGDFRSLGELPLPRFEAGEQP
jgi:hypothetical protein